MLHVLKQDKVEHIAIVQVLCAMVFDILLLMPLYSIH